MQAFGRISVGATGPAHHLARRKNLPARNTQGKEDYGSKRGRNAFLKQQFHTISPKNVTRSTELPGYNYITQENYQYLLASANSYAGASCKPLNHAADISAGASIAQLYHDLEKIVDEDVEINIETDGTRLVFVLWDYYNWGAYGIYWIPVSFVEKLPTPLRRIAISFLHQFRESMRFDTTNHNDGLGFILEWQMELIEDADKDERKEIIGLVRSYEEGRIYKLMDRIEKRNYHKDLAKALNDYTPASDYEKKLIELMTEGLQFIGPQHPTIFQYAYDQYHDEDNDEYPVYLEQRFMFIYDDDDITNGYYNYLNETAGNSYEIRPCYTLILRPDSNEVLEKDTFPEDFFNYLDKLMDFLNKEA